MSYAPGMGIGSLSKYRRFFMIGGFVIFAGGALLRWHHQRTLDSIASKPEANGPTVPVSWQADCVSYACRVIGVRGPECRDVCAQAIENGRPKAGAERIANACKKQCVADETDTALCRSECLVREAKNSR
jgi:hypothetical protein